MKEVHENQVISEVLQQMSGAILADTRKGAVSYLRKAMHVLAVAIAEYEVDNLVTVKSGGTGFMPPTS